MTIGSKRVRIADVPAGAALKVICPSCRAPRGVTCVEGATNAREGKFKEDCHLVRWTSAAESLVPE